MFQTAASRSLRHGVLVMECLRLASCHPVEVRSQSIVGAVPSVLCSVTLSVVASNHRSWASPRLPVCCFLLSFHTLFFSSMVTNICLHVFRWSSLSNDDKTVVIAFIFLVAINLPTRGELVFIPLSKNRAIANTNFSKFGIHISKFGKPSVSFKLHTGWSLV